MTPGSGSAVINSTRDNPNNHVHLITGWTGLESRLETSP